MKKTLLLIFGAGIIGLLISMAYAEINVDQFKDIPGVVLLEDNVIGGGMINESIIIKAKKLGVKSIIDLRSPDEGAGEERVIVQKHGLNYFNIPVTPYTLRKAQADVISHVLSDSNNKPVIIHSNAGNRVGALWGVYSRFYRNMNQAQAFKEAVDKGLKTDDLKDKVFKLLAD